jgi:hypothetical protein
MSVPWPPVTICANQGDHVLWHIGAIMVCCRILPQGGHIPTHQKIVNRPVSDVRFLNELHSSPETRKLWFEFSLSFLKQNLYKIYNLQLQDLD